MRRGACALAAAAAAQRALAGQVWAAAGGAAWQQPTRCSLHAGAGPGGDGPPAELFDRQRKAAQRDRAAALRCALHRPDPLLRHITERLLDRLEDCVARFPTALVLGGAGEVVAEGLAGGRAGVRRVIHMDTSPAMLALARERAAEYVARHPHSSWPETSYVLADEEHLPLAPGSVDLVVSCLGLHWVNDVPGALAQVRRALKPDGLFLGAMLGGQTLQELRISCSLAQQEREGGVSPFVSPLAQVRDAGNLLTRAALALPTVDVDTFVMRYSGAAALVSHLRLMAEGAALRVASRGALRRDTALAAAAAYQALYCDEEEAEGDHIAATYQVIFMTGWCPSSSTPRAAARGSGTVSFQEMAAALAARGATAGSAAAAAAAAPRVGDGGSSSARREPPRAAMAGSRFLAALPHRMEAVRQFTPSWFTVSMGTGSLGVTIAAFPFRFAGQQPIAWAFWWLAALQFIACSALLAGRALLFPVTLLKLFAHPNQSLFLGAIPMALSTISNGVVIFWTPHFGFSATTAAHVLFWVNLPCVLLCILLMPLTMFIIHTHESHTMSAAWLLPVVPAVVAANSAGVIASALPPEAAEAAVGLLYVGVALLGIGFLLAYQVTTIYYNRLALHCLPAREVIISSFLPVSPMAMTAWAVLNLSAAASHALVDYGRAHPAHALLDPNWLASMAPGWAAVSSALGLFLWGFSTWWLLVAVASVSTLCRTGIPFNLGWWGSVFPVGVWTGVTLHLGRVTHSSALTAIGTGAVCVHAGLWLAVATLTAHRGWTGRLFHAPCLASPDACALRSPSGEEDGVEDACSVDRHLSQAAYARPECSSDGAARGATSPAGAAA
ncbi:methyltransferase [Scenedesmus sp. PABB004]|nr:methyltransferase [Scenedesmus sp. PABB004]